MVVPNGLTSNINAANLITTPDGAQQFAAWYTLAGEIKVGRITRGTHRWGINHAEHQLAGAARTELDMPVTDDEHNFPALVVTKDWRLHLWANMHNKPNYHVVTTNDCRTDIVNWSVAAAMPSEINRNTYPTPVTFPNGNVWFYYRALQDYGLSGRANGYFWRHTGSGWSARTELFRGVPAGLESADDDISNFSPYLAYPRLTTRPGGVTRMHLFWIWRQDPYQGSSCVLPSYAYSDDEGLTYKAFDGSAVTLPITPDNNLATRTGQTSGRSRTVTDATVNATTTLTSATANFVAGDVGKYIRGLCLNNGKVPLTNQATTIATRVSATEVTLNQVANRTATAQTVIIGDDYENDPALTIDPNGIPHVLMGIHPLPRLHITMFGEGTYTWAQINQSKDLAGFDALSRMTPWYLWGDMWVLAAGEPLNARTPRAWRADGTGTAVPMGGTTYDGTDGTTQWEFMADPVAYNLFGSLEVLTPDGDSPRVTTFGRGPLVGTP